MKMIKAINAAIVLTALAGSVSAQVFTFNFPVGQAVPSPAIEGFGLSDIETITAAQISGAAQNGVADVNVLLNVVGNPIMYNSDFVAYLAHGNQTAFLINRPGVTSSASSGYGGNGMNLILDDQKGVSYDVHFYRLAPGYVAGGDNPLTGTFAPDGRTDPLGTRAANPLSVFNGTTITGDWRLYIEDSVGSSSGQLVSWGLVVTAVPEPGAYALVCGLALAAFAAYRRVSRQTV